MPVIKPIAQQSPEQLLKKIADIEMPTKDKERGDTAKAIINAKKINDTSKRILKFETFLSELTITSKPKPLYYNQEVQATIDEPSQPTNINIAPRPPLPEVINAPDKVHRTISEVRGTKKEEAPKKTGNCLTRIHERRYQTYNT